MKKDPLHKEMTATAKQQQDDDELALSYAF